MVAEYAVEMNYTVDLAGAVLGHTQRLRVKPDPNDPAPVIGQDPDTINLETKGIGGVNGSVTLSQFMDDYLDAFVQIYGTEMSVNSAVLVFYEFGIGQSGAYVSGIDLSDAVIGYATQGTDASPCEPAQQVTMTFFDSRGRANSKVNFLEVALTGNDQRGANNLPAKLQPMGTYLAGSSSPVKGTGTSDLLSIKLASFGTNEAVWRNRFRS